MKKLLLVAALAVSCVSANAELLYWQVGNSVSTDSGSAFSNYDTATVYAGGKAIVEYATPMPTAMTIDLSTVENYQNLSYYIELSTYGNSAEDSWKAKSGTFTYAELATSITSSLSDIPRLSAWNGGSSYHVTPEPTSGMLLLVGMALMALKRRRV